MDQNRSCRQQRARDQGLAKATKWTLATIQSLLLVAAGCGVHPLDQRYPTIQKFFFLTGDLPDQYHLLTLDTMQFRGCELPTFWRLSTCHLFRLFKLGSSALRSNKPVEVKLPEIQIFSQMIWKFGALRMCFSQVCRAIRRISSEP